MLKFPAGTIILAETDRGEQWNTAYENGRYYDARVLVINRHTEWDYGVSSWHEATRSDDPIDFISRTMAISLSDLIDAYGKFFHHLPKFAAKAMAAGDMPRRAVPSLPESPDYTIVFWLSDQGLWQTYIDEGEIVGDAKIRFVQDRKLWEQTREDDPAIISYLDEGGTFIDYPLSDLLSAYFAYSGDDPRTMRPNPDDYPDED
jgi:hypothetical protein